MAERGNLQSKLNAGIDAARAGNQAEARRLLQQVLSADPNNEVAWMWMASAVVSPNERRVCLERALQINPSNTRAREALRRLEAGTPGTARDSFDLRDTEVRRARRLEREGGAGGINPYFIAAGVVLLVVVIVVLLSLGGQPAPPAPVASPTVAAVIADAPTGVPAAATAPAEIVTVDPAALTPLPPTFTPTFTPTPTETPPPSPTPLPLVDYRVFYTSAASGAASTLFSAQAERGAQPFGNPTGYTAVAVSPAGNRIAFVRATRAGLTDDETDSTGEAIPEAGLPQLFVAPLDNLDAATAISDLRGSLIVSPSWSPDGETLVFASNHDGNLDIYTIAASGGPTTQLTNTDNADTDPAWSPDGRMIAFASDRSAPPYENFAGSPEIFVMNSDGSDVRQLTDDNNDSFSPAWAPDSGAIAFVSNRGGDNDIYVMDANGEGETLLTSDDNGANDLNPQFTLDGEWIFFLSNRSSSGTQQVFATDRQGREIVQITDGDADVLSLTMPRNAP